MTVKGATAWSGAFVCKDATGALAAASVGPAGTLYLNGTSNAASVTISGANPYKWTLTLPALSAGDYVQMYITATVGGIATAAFVAADAADTKRISDLNDIAATAIVSGGAITTSGGAVSTVTTTTALTGYVAPLDAAGTRGAIGLAAANLDTQLAALPTDIDVQADAAAALAAYGAAAAGDAMALTVAERNSNADALLDRANAIETNLTLREALRLIAAATAGKLSGAATATITIRNARTDNKNRIIATVDADGNRTAIVYDVS